VGEGALGVDRAHASEQHVPHDSPAIKHEPRCSQRPDRQLPLQQSELFAHTSPSERHAPARPQRITPPTLMHAFEQQLPGLEHGSPIG
jgi:hypothetical protein